MTEPRSGKKRRVSLGRFLATSFGLFAAGGLTVRYVARKLGLEQGCPMPPRPVFPDRPGSREGGVPQRIESAGSPIGVEEVFYTPPPPHREQERVLASGEIEHPEVRRESADVRATWVLVILGIAILIAAGHYYVMYRHFFVPQERAQTVRKRSPFALAPVPSNTLPPEPRLEQINRLAGDPISDVFQTQFSAERELHRFGPTADKGFIHIPIDAAMDRLAGKLPARESKANEGRRDEPRGTAR